MLRIHTFGGLAVRDDGRAMSGAAVQPRRLAVLALLARAGRRGITREKLLTLLWPDADDQRGPRTLAQAVYALRKDLGSDDAIGGLKELHLDPSIVASDVGEFDDAMAGGDYERAVALRVGPFLDGFHLAGAPEFERWVSEEREAIEHQYASALERVARAACDGGDHATGATYWRRLASLDPLNGRYAVALMETLATTGDRAGALKHARVYEVLIDQELDLPPDREVVALARRLRSEAETAATAVEPERVETAVAVLEPPAEVEAPVEAQAAAPPASTPSAEPIVAVVPPERAPPPNRRRTAMMVAAGALVAIGAAAGVGIARWRNAEAPSSPRVAASSEPVLAIGRIASYRVDSAGETLTAPVADLLATNLARATGLRVVSTARLTELLASVGGARDTSVGAVASAARRAGASELIDGTLYMRPGGQLRLDLRRTDLATGELRTTHTIEGRDVFALVDSGTARLVAAVGGTAPASSVADVTTRSVVAYRLYTEGLQRRAVLDLPAAAHLFRAAIAEDSTFAMAYYALSQSVSTMEEVQPLIARALQLSAKATDRERLMIRAGYAFRISSPALGAYAETLAVRYPDEVEGPLYRGVALNADDQYAAAIPYLEAVVRMDSSAVLARRPRCAACDALQTLVYVYIGMDSLAAAEREARRWVRLQPSSAPAWATLASVLDSQERPNDAMVALRTMDSLEGGAVMKTDGMVAHFLRTGDYTRADRLLIAQRDAGSRLDTGNANWYLALGKRERGQLVEALAIAQHARDALTVPGPRDAAPPSAVLEAQILLELGRGRASAALYDSISRWRAPQSEPSSLARNRAWTMTHAANGLALAGDTAGLIARADMVAATGGGSLLGRDHRLHHHIRGLLFAARGRDADAATEFRAAISTFTMGYTRSNLELARALMRLHRAPEAIAALQPALRAGIEGSALYVNRTELHELLAQAWEAAGRRDSANAHYAIVARDWAQGDPAFAARAAAARGRLGVRP